MTSPGDTYQSRRSVAAPRGPLPQIFAPPLAKQRWHRALTKLRRSPATVARNSHFGSCRTAQLRRLLVFRRHVSPPDSSTPPHGAVSHTAVTGVRPPSEAPSDALGQALQLMRAMCLSGARRKEIAWSFCPRRKPSTSTTTHRADLFAAESSKSPPLSSSSPLPPPPPPGRKRARGSLERTSVGSK